MPTYSFFCEKCKLHFEMFFSISKYEEKPVCEKCQSNTFTARDYKTDLCSLLGSVVKSDSELKTIGDLANRNRDRFSQDKKSSLYSKHNEYKDQESTKELPKGMSRIQKPKTKTKWST